MRTLVTGGSGFVGRHLAAALRQRGDEVTCLDTVPPASADGDGTGIRFVRCDAGSWAELLRAVHGASPELVFHTAGILSAAAEERPQAAYRANAVSTFNLLEATSLLGVKRLVLTSTIATYGPGVARIVNEATQQRPTTMYGVSKVFAELLGEYYQCRFGVDFRALRLPSVIGAGRGPGGASAYTSLIVSEPAAGRSFEVPVSERATMPIAYIKDAVAALIRLSEAASESLRRRTYGMGGFSPTAGELAEAVRVALPGARIAFAPDPKVVAIVDSWPDRIDGSEALRDWGFEERYDLTAAVEDFAREVSLAAGDRAPKAKPSTRAG
ncbi:MAG: NAD-dependent epimerase/dehydratase family protein [Solirubrobacterales bacterium]